MQGNPTIILYIKYKINRLKKLNIFCFRFSFIIEKIPNDTDIMRVISMPVTNIFSLFGQPNERDLKYKNQTICAILNKKEE